MIKFDDPYCYPGTEVLKNKQDLRDSQHALEIEREYSLLRRREIELDPVRGWLGPRVEVQCLCEFRVREWTQEEIHESWHAD
ncbi:hypothetical protein ABIB51_004666, partial [Arthrobacter sp. UYCu712]